MTTPTENIVAGQDEQGSVCTSTMVDPQVRRMQTAKKMLRGCGGTEGKTNELMTVTWRRKPDRNDSRYCICLLSRWKRSFRHHMQMSCTFPRMNVSPASVRKEKSTLVILKLDFQLFLKTDYESDFKGGWSRTRGSIPAAGGDFTEPQLAAASNQCPQPWDQMPVYSETGSIFTDTKSSR